MKAILSIVAGVVVGATFILACGDTNDTSSVPEQDAAPDSPGADTSSFDASDGGGPEAARDARPPFDAATPEVTCAVTPCIKSLVAGIRDYCATDSDGVVRCWGDPTALGGFVDHSNENAGATPVVLSGLDDIVDVGIGPYDTCVVTADGKVHCFGSSSETPVTIDGVDTAKKVFVGDSRRCAILASGELWCWGDSYDLGTGVGAADIGGGKAIGASIRSYMAFALVEDGRLFSWGSERYTLGRNTVLSPDLIPAPVVGLPPAMQVASSDSHACALTVDGRLFCWGRGGDNGALGLGYVRHEFFPVEVLFPGPEWPVQIAAQQSHSCARMSDGSLTCWSRYNSSGWLGIDTREGVYSPTKVTSLTKKIVSVAVGDSSTCAVIEDGSVQCWGDNQYGQLGMGTKDSSRHATPTNVVFP